MLNYQSEGRPIVTAAGGWLQGSSLGFPPVWMANSWSTAKVPRETAKRSLHSHQDIWTVLKNGARHGRGRLASWRLNSLLLCHCVPTILPVAVIKVHYIICVNSSWFWSVHSCFPCVFATLAWKIIPTKQLQDFLWILATWWKWICHMPSLNAG